MIRLVLVSSFVVILGFYQAKGAPNGLLLKNDEARAPYRSIEKGADLAAGRLVEGKFGGVEALVTDYPQIAVGVALICGLGVVLEKLGRDLALYSSGPEKKYQSW
ncbi:uncharacterized protein LOC129004115 isoform X2 [Macrosteles quadrilineatus]|uniref:uncharacterized protein LOC129004115 isoform X2 n=1 Tax=Macrosteles quadrilineatus TaxID=74068 RepID=UPI0023E0CFCE|nr:uncharacterized protein LOC129004115 isoform X2 [Macrosteles quadrilineatus]